MTGARPSPEQLQRWMETALRAGRDAGEILERMSRKVDPSSIESKMVNDWVSPADRASEAAILSALQRETPKFSILTEETGYLAPPGSPSHYCWIIDPLDGTTNFLRGFPIWAVSIGLEYRPDPRAKWGEIVAGAIVVPPTGEEFSAARSFGAYRNGERIISHASRPMEESLLATGFPFRVRHLSEPYLALFHDILLRCADVRRPGAVSVDLCYTAMGIFDGFWELDLGPWDIAAGSLIIEESGGSVCNFQGERDILTSGDIVAGNAVAFPILRSLTEQRFPTARDVNKAPRR